MLSPFLFRLSGRRREGCCHYYFFQVFRYKPRPSLRLPLTSLALLSSPLFSPPLHLPPSSRRGENHQTRLTELLLNFTIKFNYKIKKTNKKRDEASNHHLISFFVGEIPFFHPLPPPLREEGSEERKVSALGK